MGCPQVPVQTPAVIYISHRLRGMGIVPVLAGTPSADMLIRYSDPARHYIGEVRNLDSEIAGIAEGEAEYGLCFVFVHNDSGVVYTATLHEMLDCEIIPVVFGENFGEISERLDFTARRIVSKAVHNPKPLIAGIDGVMKWDA